VVGLHYQTAPRAQGKLVRVVQGAAFDVAVDIRRSSAHFGRWVGVALSAQNKRQLWVPEGFAHAFLALEDDTHFLYKTTDTYSKDNERSIRWDDAQIGIVWPRAGTAGGAEGRCRPFAGRSRGFRVTNGAQLRRPIPRYSTPKLFISAGS
jgi:dTDP-4-dehydrorhamnose 3,5-epimerase